MSTLVGLGASASFGVSCIAAGLPSLGWKTFFEEPAMLLGFVLVGRALEERAKLQASADMAALQVMPVKLTELHGNLLQLFHHETSVFSAFSVRKGNGVVVGLSACTNCAHLV